MEIAKMSSFMDVHKRLQKL